jgi:hypothetical protein
VQVEQGFGTGFVSAQGRISTAENGVMLEILRNFEFILGEAARVRPMIVIGAGVAAVAVGLFVWLGGLGLRRVLVAVAGAITGGILGFVLIGRGVIPAGASAGAAAVVAVLFERLSVAILAAALAAAIGFAVLVRPILVDPQALSPANQDETSTQTTTVSGDVILTKLRAYAVDVGSEFRRAAPQMPPYEWAIIAVLAAIFTVGGLIFRRVVPALCFSVLGTILIFVGMSLLLLYKGVEPVSRISSQPAIYAGVLAAMTAFGTVEQLVLCRAAKAQARKKKGPARENQGAEERQRSWRTG